MRRSCFLCVAVALSLGVSGAFADTLALRNGKTIDGTFIGGTARQLDFLPASGQSMKVPLADVVSLHISSPPQPAPPPAPPARPAARPP